jgi:arylsulfatase A-like enzyme
MTRPARPNILCIVSEDCPPRLGAYGDRLARTPHLDALASQGTVFEAAFSTSPVCAPSRFAILTGRHGESCPPANQMTGFGSTPPGVVSYPEMMRAEGYYCTNNAKTHYNCDIDPASIWDESSPNAHWRNRRGDQPFLAVFNCMETHESCVFEQKAGGVLPSDVRLPSYLPDTEGTRFALANYYNSIERMDRFMGERLRELDEAGETEDTVVFYYSDHGSPLPRSKRFCYDEGLRVPLIVLVPERWRHLLPARPGSRISEPVSLIDLLPTFASLAGCAAPSGIHGTTILSSTPRRYAFSGRDRMDEHADTTRTVRSSRYRYIRNYAPHRIWGQHYAFAWESRAYKDYEQQHLAGTLSGIQDRFWQPKQAEELYDLASDPDEVTNLADGSEHRALIDEMRAALDAHIIAIYDCGFIPEGSAAESWESSRDRGVYPLADVLSLANRAIRRDPTDIAAFVAALAQPSPVMRFWAAQGLLMLAATGHPMPESVAAALSAEFDPHVRVPLAEALGYGDPDPQIELLCNIVATDTNDRLRLQALDALTYLPHRPAIALETITHAAADADEYVRGAAEYLRLQLLGEYSPKSQVFRFDLYAGGAQAGMAHRTPAATGRAS